MAHAPVFTDNVLKAAYRVAQSHHNQAMPDIHLYLDYSGAMHDDHHKTVVQDIIRVARFTGVDLYVTSYSHEFGETMLCTFDRNLSTTDDVQAVWEQIVALPKASGGTDYQIIWDRINNSGQVYAMQLSINVTDFWWTPPDTVPMTTRSPQNLYYAQIDPDVDSFANYVLVDAIPRQEPPSGLSHFLNAMLWVDSTSTVMTKIINRNVNAPSPL